MGKEVRNAIRTAVAVDPPAQRAGDSFAVRRYADWTSPHFDGRFRLNASQSLPTTDGRYIVHSGGKGRPHAVFLELVEGGTTCIVLDGKEKFTLPRQKMADCCRQGYDHKTLVFFTVDEQIVDDPAGVNRGFLSLLAT